MARDDAAMMDRHDGLEPLVDTPPKPNARAKLLREAEQIVNGDRNAQYGDPNQDFRRTAELWNTYLTGLLERRSAETPRTFMGVTSLVGSLIEPHDVAMMMILLKISRGTVSPKNFDTWLDIAGYAACGWDCASSD